MIATQHLFNADLALKDKHVKNDRIVTNIEWVEATNLINEDKECHHNNLFNGMCQDCGQDFN